MSAKITKFPGGRPASAGDGGASGATAANSATLARLIEFYRGFGDLPLDRIEAESVGAISRALDEERYQDAMDLVDIVLESAEAVEDDVDAIELDSDEFDSPIPEAAQIWKFDGSTVLPKTKLYSVGSCGKRKLLPTRISLNSDFGNDWEIRCGDIGLWDSEEAKLELGLKGELFLMLFAGSITVSAWDDEDAVTSLASVDGHVCLYQIVYCRDRNNHAPLAVSLRSNGGGPVRGIWCVSSRFRLDDQDRNEDPDQDAFFAREFHPVVLATPRAGFCAKSERIKEKKYYAHYESVRRRELARFDLASGNFSSHHAWSVDPWTKQTKVSGVRAAQVRRFAREAPDHQLRTHPGSLEFIVALNGATWIAVTPYPPEGPSGEQETPSLGGHQADVARTPAWITAIVAREGMSHDVLLLNPSYAHCAWTTPGSDARFLHLLFNDPKSIRATAAGDHERRDAVVEFPLNRVTG
jgi:hypothetical protein